jgi:hypothetical protein
VPSTLPFEPVPVVQTLAFYDRIALDPIDLEKSVLEMETPKKIILATWLVAAFLGLVLIIFTRPRRSGEELNADQKLQKAIIGRWQAAHETDEFLTDGTFVFSVANGTGQQRVVSGKYTFPDATTLQLSLDSSDTKIVFTDVDIKDETMSTKSKDGRTAVYHRVAAAEGIQPNAETSRLKNAILGKWQSSGKSETDEWSDDGRLVIATTQGRTVACRYEVVDSSHVQVTRDGAGQPSSTWTVAIKGDAMTVDATTGNGPAVATFSRMKSNLAIASPLPSVERQISPRPPPVQPAQGQPRTSSLAELKRAIVGKWQRYGEKEIDEWSDDGTVVITNDEGTKLDCTYHLNGNDRVLVVPDGSSPMGSPIWTVEISGDLMSLTTPTNDGPDTSYFVRLDSKGQAKAVTIPAPGPAGDRSAVLGRWNSPGKDQLVCSQDGTFVFGESKGQWEMKNGEVVARESPHGTIWKLRLSPDGRSLSGYWSGHVKIGPVAGSLTLTR